MLLSASSCVLQHHAASAPTRRFRYLHSYTFSCQFPAAKNDDSFRHYAHRFLQHHTFLEDMYFAKAFPTSVPFPAPMFKKPMYFNIIIELQI